jgi:hypothetical protein
VTAIGVLPLAKDGLRADYRTGRLIAESSTSMALPEGRLGSIWATSRRAGLRILLQPVRIGVLGSARTRSASPSHEGAHRRLLHVRPANDRPVRLHLAH